MFANRSLSDVRHRLWIRDSGLYCHSWSFFKYFCHHVHMKRKSATNNIYRVTHTQKGKKINAFLPLAAQEIQGKKYTTKHYWRLLIISTPKWLWRLLVLSEELIKIRASCQRRKSGFVKIKIDFSNNTTTVYIFVCMESVHVLIFFYVHSQKHHLFTINFAKGFPFNV